MSPVTVPESKLLAEIGFLAAGRGLPSVARNILEGLLEANPDESGAVIGLALADLSEKNFDQAISILQKRILDADPDNDMGLAFLGMSLKLAGRAAESDIPFDRVIARNADMQAVELAKSMKSETV
ncbi:tetratricopeptide repeat protein [Thalassospira sp. MA62]|nr:tetratricopeptide repeat protein [Thalassospira sp. MA62]